jgi:hypothetical protein
MLSPVCWDNPLSPAFGHAAKPRESYNSQQLRACNLENTNDLLCFVSHANQILLSLQARSSSARLKQAVDERRLLAITFK